MLDHLLAWLASAIIGVISATGYLGIVLLMAAESACLPIPSEVIMPFAGYLASTGRFHLWLAATAGAVGCNLGSTIAYAIGHHGGRPLAERFGRYVLISRRDLDRADRFFGRWGGVTVFIARLLPVVRTYIALPAGIARMSWLPFQILTFVGSWFWCYVLAYIGFVLGDRWRTDPRLAAILHRFDIVIILAVVLLVVWHVWRHLRERHREAP